MSCSHTEPEKNETYELGAKLDFFNGALGLRTAVFQTYKLNARTTDPVLGIQVTDGKQRVRGFEIELVGQIMRNWNVWLAYAYLDSRITSSQDIQTGVPIEGKRLANVPENSASLWTTYDITPQWQVGGGANFVDKRYANTDNLNVVPSIAANGGVTVWLWIISLLLFFWPQGIAVIELAHRYPGEGGVYLWAKEVFGDFHGFLSGWCYWTNNMLYVPTVMLYFVGVSVYVLGPGHHGLADNKIFAATVSLTLLVVALIFSPAVLIATRPLGYLSVSIALACSASGIASAWANWRKALQLVSSPVGIPGRSK